MPLRWARICWVMTVVAATIGLVVPADAARAHTVGKRAHVPVVLRLGGPRTKLKHIVFFVKENRSFDHYSCAFPDPTNPLDQAMTASCAGLGGVRTFTMARASEPVTFAVSSRTK